MAKKSHSKPTPPANGSLGHSLHSRFTHFAQYISHVTGHPAAFLLAVLVVIVWGVTGPLFNYSDTWQLVINTGTTIVTFLMVFLIQNTQNRDTLALQLKLSELVFASHGAKNKYAALEKLEDEELEQLHDEFCKRAAFAGQALDTRRSHRQRTAAQRAKSHVRKSRRKTRKS